MNILLVSPQFLQTFWLWDSVVRFVGKKAAFPPLGLLTVAAMLPKLWQKKLVDLSIQKLVEEDIKWADYVFIGAMLTQKNSAKEVITRCKNLHKPVILGGPILETGCAEFSDDVSHFLIGEAEDTLLEFLADLQKGEAKKTYSFKNFPNLATSPIPLWELINPKDYASLLVQYCRGCPYGCTFCNTAKNNGRITRTKSTEQFLRELDVIYETGFKGAIFVADDNFIGDKKKIKEMLAELIKWQQFRGYPFDFTAEVDITLVDDPILMDSMVLAGFKKVFLGLETSNKASLIECNKIQNVNRDMVACVKIIQNHGLVPMSGFIVGFDSDPPDTFDTLMINFIQATGIVIAMVGVLQAPQGTPLCKKLRQENRLLAQSSGNNIDCRPNFEPRMSLETLVRGYKRIVETIYSPRKYYERICVFLREYNASKRIKKKNTATDLKAFVISILRIGLFGRFTISYYYWKTLAVAFFKYRPAFSEAVALQIYGFHFQRIAESIQKA